MIKKLQPLQAVRTVLNATDTQGVLSVKRFETVRIENLHHLALK